MREPQVVRSARVQRMSLCATAMPVSGPAAPRARCSSARRAAARARDSSTLMNAFNSRCARMRARHCPVSSTAEILPAASAAESSVTVAFSKLLDDLRHEIQARVYRRRGRLVALARVRLGHFIGPQFLYEVERVRHGLDA